MHNNPIHETSKERPHASHVSMSASCLHDEEAAPEAGVA